MSTKPLEKGDIYMKKMKSKIDWVLVGIIVAVSLPIIATGSLLVVWDFQMNEQEIQYV